MADGTPSSSPSSSGSTSPSEGTGSGSPSVGQHTASSSPSSSPSSSGSSSPSYGTGTASDSPSSSPSSSPSDSASATPSSSPSAAATTMTTLLPPGKTAATSGAFNAVPCTVSITHGALRRNEFVQILGQDPNGNYAEELFRFTDIGQTSYTFSFYANMKVYRSVTTNDVMVAFAK